MIEDDAGLISIFWFVKKYDINPDINNRTIYVTISFSFNKSFLSYNLIIANNTIERQIVYI